MEINDILKANAGQFPVDEILNEADRLVKGWMSVECKDKQGEIVPVAELRKTLNTWMSRGAPITDQHCHSEDTQVFTNNGFKHFYELNSEDEVATLNPYSHEFEFQKPTDYQAIPYKGTMLHFKGQMYDFLVSPEHRMYLKDKEKGKYLFMTAGQLATKGINKYRYAFKKNCNWNCLELEYYQLQTSAEQQKKFKDYYSVFELRQKGMSVRKIAARLKLNEGLVEGWVFNKSKPVEIDSPTQFKMDTWIKFMAWYLSEGYINENIKTGHHFVRISQSQKNHVKREEIIQTIINMGFSPFECNGDIAFTSRMLCNYLKKFGHAKEKYIPYELKQMPWNKLRLFIDTYIKGDGTNGRHIFTSSKKMRDDLVEICLKAGYGVFVSKRQSGFTKRWDGYQVSISRKKVEPLLFSGEIIEEQYDGKIYCVTVPNGILLTERNGKLTWSGNSNRVIGKGLRWYEQEHPITKTQGIIIDYQIFKDYSIDNEAWEQIKSHKRKGLSFGGRATEKSTMAEDPYSGSMARRLAGIEGYEVASVMDPANQFGNNIAINYLAKSNKEFEAKKKDMKEIISFDLFSKLYADLSPEEKKVVGEQTADYMESMKKAHEEAEKLAADLQKGYVAEDIKKPFAGFKSFDVCVESQKTKGHGDDAAQRICGWLQNKEKQAQGYFQEVSTEEKRKKGIEIETKEHPQLDEATIKQLVMDHLNEDPAYYDTEEGDFIETQKGRIYLQPGQQAPKGSNVQQGKRGGKYYEESGGAQGKTPGEPGEFPDMRGNGPGGSQGKKPSGENQQTRNAMATQQTDEAHAQWMQDQEDRMFAGHEKKPASAGKENTFEDVLANPEGKKIVEQIEEIGDSNDSRLSKIKENLVNELKQKFGYDYLDADLRAAVATGQPKKPEQKPAERTNHSGEEIQNLTGAISSAIQSGDKEEAIRNWDYLVGSHAEYTDETKEEVDILDTSFKHAMIAGDKEHAKKIYDRMTGLFINSPKPKDKSGKEPSQTYAQEQEDKRQVQEDENDKKNKSMSKISKSLDKVEKGLRIASISKKLDKIEKCMKRKKR